MAHLKAHLKAQPKETHIGHTRNGLTDAFFLSGRRFVVGVDDVPCDASRSVIAMCIVITADVMGRESPHVNGGKKGP
jgi:hypothetical protein